MKCKEIIELLEQYSPKSHALEWDNVSLLVGSESKEVNNILVVLDVDIAAIDYAIANNVDLIVSHHPVIFSSMKSVTDTNYNGERIYKLLKHDIAVYSMHTNYDATHMANLAANMLDIHNAENFEENGIGKMSKCSPMTLEAWAKRVKKAFSLDMVKVYGELSKTVETVVVYPGSGKDAIGLALTKNADLIITGDIGHHNAIDAMDQGLSIIDATHYGIECIFIENVAKYLESVVQCKVIKQAINNPVKYI